jgi:hypothetical protein
MMLTPAPVDLDKPATMRDVFQVMSEHEGGCPMKEIATQLRVGKWIFGIAMTLLVASIPVSLILAKYAMIGAINVQLQSQHLVVKSP